MLISKKRRRKIRYRLVYGLVQALISISNAMPRKLWLGFCGFLGSVAYHFAAETRRLTIKHLHMAFPEKTSGEVVSLAKGTFKMLGKNFGEVLRSTGITELSEVEKFITITGYENLERAYAKGKGVIVLPCHLGAFDLQVTYMAMRGWKPNVVGTPLKDKRLNNLLWKHRNKYGAVAVERGRETFTLLKTLKAAGIIALLIDQDTKVKSCFVNFFGMPAATPVGAAMLALKTGAVALPMHIYLGEDNLQHMNILPEVPLHVTGNEEADIIYNTQAFSNVIEQAIRQHPEQWVWMHERWKTKPSELTN